MLQFLYERACSMYRGKPDSLINYLPHSVVTKFAWPAKIESAKTCKWFSPGLKLMYKASRKLHERCVCAKKGRWNQLTWIYKKRTLRTTHQISVWCVILQNQVKSTALVVIRNHIRGGKGWRSHHSSVPQSNRRRTSSRRERLFILPSCAFYLMKLFVFCEASVKSLKWRRKPSIKRKIATTLQVFVVVPKTFIKQFPQKK